MQFGSQHVSCGIQMGNDDKRINFSLRYIICQSDSKKDRIINQQQSLLLSSRLYIYIYIYIYIMQNKQFCMYYSNYHIATLIQEVYPKPTLNNKVKHICHCWKIGKSHLIMVLSLSHMVFESLRYHISVRMKIIQHICQQNTFKVLSIILLGLKRPLIP